MRAFNEHFVAWRIGDPSGVHPIYSAEGARLVEARWHEKGDSVIYASEHYSTAMLEKLAHWNGMPPSNQHYIEITIPAGVTYEMVTPDHLPEWHRADGHAARAFGHRWYTEGRSAVLLVPSVVARMERNVVINAVHEEFGRIKMGLETPVWWDERLFAERQLG